MPWQHRYMCSNIGINIGTNEANLKLYLALLWLLCVHAPVPWQHGGLDVQDHGAVFTTQQNSGSALAVQSTAAFTSGTVLDVRVCGLMLSDRAG